MITASYLLAFGFLLAVIKCFKCQRNELSSIVISMRYLIAIGALAFIEFTGVTFDPEYFFFLCFLDCAVIIFLNKHVRERCVPVCATILFFSAVFSALTGLEYWLYSDFFYNIFDLVSLTMDVCLILGLINCDATKRRKYFDLHRWRFNVRSFMRDKLGTARNTQ